MQLPTILFLEPNRVWRTYPGGRELDVMEGKEPPGDTHFPEDWIASTTRAINLGREHLEEEGLSKVDINGEQWLLKKLCEKYPNEILGAEHFAKFGSTTQFLIKFLDSAIRLHLQCHPTIPFAKEFLDSNSGKTEAYVILGSREEIADPYIYLGFQNPPTVEEFKHVIETQDTDKLLSYFEKIPIQPGDVFIVPGGMPHAIGEGVYMIEIMEPTDLVARIEFERGGYTLPEAARFMNRGIDFALTMFNYDAVSVDQIKTDYFCQPQELNATGDSTEFSIIDQRHTECFSVKRLEVQGLYKKAEDSFYVGVVTKNSGKVTIDGMAHSLNCGDRFLIPHSTRDITFESTEAMELIFALPPKV